MNPKDDKNVQNSTTEELGGNDIIQKCTGSFGRWHVWVFFLICLVKFPVAFHQLNILVLAPKVDFWCENQDVAKCSSNCSKHVFDKSTFSNTITMQWDLVCKNQYLESTAQTLTMLGILLGSFVFGYLSDRFGRKLPLVWASMVQLIAGLLTAYVPWLYLFLLLRFLTSFVTGGTMVTSFVLIMEIVGVKWRTKLGILYQIPFNLGHLLIPTISYFVRDWQLFQLAISIPSIIFISYYWILPESPRWLLAVGESEKAIQVMVKAAKCNNLQSTKIEYEVKTYMDTQASLNMNQSKGNIFDLLRTPIMRTYSLVVWINWLFCGLSFYGSSQYIGQLGGNIFLNLAMSAFSQIPGVLFCCWIIDVWGRKKTQIVFNIFCGVILIVSGFVPNDPDWIKPTLSSIGIAFSIAAFSTVYIYAGEVFPTVIRNVGIGSASMFARVGSMVAPFIANLTFGYTWIPPFIFGATMIVGALLCLLLPETLNCKLPETIEDVEELDKLKAKM